MKSIFILKNTITSDIIQQYIDLSIQERGKGTGCFYWCFGISFNSAVCFTKSEEKNIKDSSDDILKWIYDLSIGYLRSSGVNDSNLSLSLIECINCDEPVLLRNSKYYNIIYHFNGKYGYITTHTENLNYLVDDKKYILLSFDKVDK